MLRKSQTYTGPASRVTDAGLYWSPPSLEGVPETFSTVSFPFNSDQDKIYFTVELGTTGDNILTPATYNNNFNLPLLDDPEKYYCAVSRFSCPATEIPVFIPDFQTGSTTITIYSVTLTYNGNTHKTSVIYTPTNGYPTNSEFYPYVYVYQDFLTMINNAFATAFSFISPPVGSQAPYLQFDPTTSLISLVVQRTFYDKNAALPINIYFNQPLAVLLTGLDVIDAPNGTLSDINGEDVLVNVYDQKNNWYQPIWAPVVSPPDYYILTQSYPSVLAWSPLKSIRLITNTIPIKREYVVSQNLDSQLSGVGVLQTFIPLFNEGLGHATSINYTPSQYHLLNMAGHQPIKQIDFQFQWVDGEGVSHNVFIPYNEVCSVSFVFLKKTTYTS